MTIHARVTPSLHPDNIKNLKGYDDSTSGYVTHALNAFSTAYESINDIHIARDASKRNPAWTDANAMIMTDEFASKKLQGITRALDSATSNLRNGIAHIESELSAPFEINKSSPLAIEIRAHVKSMPTAKRRDFINSALSKNDDLTLSAILGAPAFLSGQSDMDIQYFTRQYHEKKNPQLTQRLEVMNGALNLLNDRSGLIFPEIEKAIGASALMVKRLRDAKNDAEKAFILKDIEPKSNEDFV